MKNLRSIKQRWLHLWQPKSSWYFYWKPYSNIVSDINRNGGWFTRVVFVIYNAVKINLLRFFRKQKKKKKTLNIFARTFVSLLSCRSSIYWLYDGGHIIRITSAHTGVTIMDIDRVNTRTMHSSLCPCGVSEFYVLPYRFVFTSYEFTDLQWFAGATGKYTWAPRYFSSKLSITSLWG